MRLSRAVAHLLLAAAAVADPIATHQLAVRLTARVGAPAVRLAGVQTLGVAPFRKGAEGALSPTPHATTARITDTTGTISRCTRRSIPYPISFATRLATSTHPPSRMAPSSRRALRAVTIHVGRRHGHGDSPKGHRLVRSGQRLVESGQNRRARPTHQPREAPTIARLRSVSGPCRRWHTGCLAASSESFLATPDQMTDGEATGSQFDSHAVSDWSRHERTSRESARDPNSFRSGRLHRSASG